MPGKTPPHSVSQETIKGWRDRRGLLLTKLASDPGGPWAWLWRVHVDIMDYLLHRYAGVGDDPLAGSVVVPYAHAEGERSPVTDHPDAALEDLSRPYERVAFRRPAVLEGADAEKLRSSMRRRLTSLHATNTERRAAQPPILPTPPPRGYRYNPDSLRPMPGWIEFLFTLPEQPFKLSGDRPRGEGAFPSPSARGYWVLRTTYPEHAGEARARVEQTGVDPLDADSLALLQRALAGEKDWQLDDGGAWSEADIARLLAGEQGMDGSAEEEA